VDFTPPKIERWDIEFGSTNRTGNFAMADLSTMEAHMTAYYASIGKGFSDFKSVIPLVWMVGGARLLPRVVET
jgi:hypothetical protein